jgi:hypothetical protein
MNLGMFAFWAVLAIERSCPARLYRVMMVDIMQQDWNGAKHLNKPGSTEQTLQLIPCLEQAKKMQSDAVYIIKHAIKK